MTSLISRTHCQNCRWIGYPIRVKLKLSCCSEYIYIYIYPSTYTPIYIHIYIHTHEHIQIYIYTYTNIYIFRNQHENEAIQHTKTLKVPMNDSLFQLQLHPTPRRCKGDTLSMAWIMIQRYYWYIYFRNDAMKPSWHINKFCSKILLISLDTRRYRWSGSSRLNGWKIWKRAQRNVRSHGLIVLKEKKIIYRLQT